LGRNALHFKKSLVFFGLVGGLILLKILSVRHHPQSLLSPDILHRSRQYLDQFEEQPLTNLTLEQKLILLHSHYNLGHYVQVVQLAGQMGKKIDLLPEERRSAFLKMIRDAEARMENPKL